MTTRKAQQGQRPLAAFFIMIAVILTIALISGGAALALTVIAPSHDAQRYTSLALIFMDTFKMCVGALIGVIASARLA